MPFTTVRISRAYLIKAAVAAIDAALVVAALYGAYLIRFDFGIWSVYGTQLLDLLPVFVLIRLTALYYTRSYSFIWKYASVTDLLKVLKAIVGGMSATTRWECCWRWRSSSRRWSTAAFGGFCRACSTSDCSSWGSGW